VFRHGAFGSCLVVFIASAFAAEELRTWKDTTGTFSIEARFVKLADGVVQLETAAGKGMKIPLDKLAPADANAAQELADKAAASPTGEAEMRTWSDATGKFKFQGKFDKVDGDTVFLLDPDGKSMKIPLAKLSPADQDYVKARPAANPFEDLGNAGKSKTAAPGKPFVSDKQGPAQILRPDWVKAKILLPSIVSGKWKIAVPEIAASKPLVDPPRIEPNVDLDKDWAKLYSLRLSENKQRALLCFQTHKVTRLMMYDVTNGKEIGQATLDGQFNVLDFSDDGEKILVGGNAYNDRDFVEIWALTPKGIVRERGWSNKRDRYESWAEVKAALFVDEKRALIFQAERLTLWNTVTATPLAVLGLKRVAFGEPVYAYHAGAKLLAVQQGRELCVMETTKGDLVAATTLIEDEIPNALAWRPDAKQLALRTTLNKLLILDTATGERLREVDLSEFTIPHSSTSKLDWPTEPQILINRGFVYDLRHSIPLWNYDGLENLEFGCGHAWAWFKGDTHDKEKPALVPLMMPHQAVRDLANKYTPPPRVLILPAGSKVALDTTEIVDPTIQPQAAEALTKQLAGYGYPVSATAECQLIASMSVGATTELAWRDFTRNGTGQEVRRNFSPIICKLQLKNGDQVVWEKTSSGYPLNGSVFLRENETIDTRLAEQEKPRYDLFLKPRIPKYKPSDNDKVLGKSTLTHEGLK
jgi:hypothetical protein